MVSLHATEDMIESQAGAVAAVVVVAVSNDH